MFSINYLYTIRNNFGFIFLEQDYNNTKKLIEKIGNMKKEWNGDLYLFINDNLKALEDHENLIFCHKYYESKKNNFPKSEKIKNLDIK